MCSRALELTSINMINIDQLGLPSWRSSWTHFPEREVLLLRNLMLHHTSSCIPCFGVLQMPEFLTQCHLTGQWWCVFTDYSVLAEHHVLRQQTHYCDVIMGAMVSQITSSRLFTKPSIQAHIKENIKAPGHWPLCGEFTVTGEFPAQMASNAENVSIWWRHRAKWAFSQSLHS